MGKTLVIVESPSKAKIINGYLGSDYIVRASVGHIRDLPASSSKSGVRKAPARTEEEKQQAQIDRLGVDPYHGWKAKYEIMPEKKKVVSELRALAEESDKVYLATDLDREGEAIAWHLQEVLHSKKRKDQQFWRVKYPEITKQAITKAFAHPDEVNMNLVHAQQTRRFLDRVVGFMVSPLLWAKVGRGLSAGRVQSVAVELIVRREREIKAFNPQEYWSIDAITRTAKNAALQLSLATKGGKKVEIHNAKEAQAIVEVLEQNQFKVQSVECKKGSTHAPAPFTTSTLQQTANKLLGFSVKRTMIVAQKLYESGFITYMRTDSVNLSQEAIEAAREIISKDFGDKYLPEKPNLYHSGESAQEAHEAIRPSHPDARQLPTSLDRDCQRLYKLIFDRYLACQMANQTYESRSIAVSCGEYILRASGRTETFPGFRAVLASKSEDSFLPDTKEGEILTLEKVHPERHFTKPPARYSEASLVKEMEKDGIGRPSTYASIIATIQDRGYVKLENNRFFATKMGEIVTDRLCFSFANLMDAHFTASMEKNLDEIAAGNAQWIESLDKFFADFTNHLDKARLPPEQGGMPNNRVIATEMLCPSCGKYHMGIQTGKTGVFLSCMGYHDAEVKKVKDRCHTTINLVPAAKTSLPEGQEMDETLEAKLLLQSKRCPKCGSTMDAYIIDPKHKLYICSNSPVCDGNILDEGEFADEIDLGPTIVCERCGHDMILKEGRFGRYMQCTNSECGNTRKIMKNGEVAPPREDPVDLPELPCKAEGAHYVLRDGASGLFLAANTFPSVRETRQVKVSELHRFRDRLSPKFYYLADAPQTDPDGNPTIVRYSRKFKEQFVSSMKEDGKTAIWSAFYNKESNSWRGMSATKAASASKSTKKSTKA